MKICMLTTGFPRFPGDFSGIFVFQLARELVRAGAEVRVVCPHGPGLPTFENMDGLEVRRFRYAFPSSLQRLAYGGGIPTNLRRSWLARLEVPGFLGAMACAARRWGRRADVVHAHWTVSAFAASWSPALARRPLVLTVHGSDLKRVEGRAHRWATIRALRAADRVLAVSQDLRAEVLARDVPERNVRLLPNGVDLEIFSGRSRDEARRKLGLPQEARIVLFVGQIVPVKDPLALAETAAALKDASPPAEFHVVGDGPEARALQARAAELDVADRVVLHGLRPHTEIPAWLTAADMLVLPSLSEGRPTVVLEAMAAARPVVATRVGGTGELVDDGKTGVLVEAGDASKLSEAVRGLASDPALARHMGLAGRERIEALGLTWRAQAARCLELYEELVGEGQE